MLVAALAAMTLLLPANAHAVIQAAVTIDGPSENVVGFGGVAMAEDGTGGLVYLERVEGVPHVFVSRYVGGHWLEPIRVDSEEPYAASWARIGAAEGGELIVVWATPYATFKEKPVYELLGAELGPGAEQFGPAAIADADIEEATGTSPDLAVSSTGQADVVYRVVEPAVTDVPLLRPGDVVEQVRVAHFDGNRWSDLGAINRDSAVSMRSPAQANDPAIAINAADNGIVVWQEPTVEGVARIWARRIFGSSLDYVMPISAESYNGTPITQDADAASVAFSRRGQAEIAYRQSTGPGSALPGPRIFLNTVPDGGYLLPDGEFTPLGESPSGTEPTGAGIVDQGVSSGIGTAVGPPSVDMDEDRELRLLYDANGTPRVLEGNEHGLTPAFSLGPRVAGSEMTAASVMNPAGGGVSAWPSADGRGAPAVAVREDFPGGAVQTALISGGAGGEVGELSVGRSGLGDALVAFRQGPFGNASIVAAHISAPPVAPILSVPRGWVKPAKALVSWEPSESSDGPSVYHVVLDGRLLAVPQGELALHLNPRGLGSGRHRVQVLVTGVDGSVTLSAPATLLVDGMPPPVGIGLADAGRAVKVRVREPYSEVEESSVRVSFGDGDHARGRLSYLHHYRHPGVYRVTVSARDEVGNAATVSRWLSVR
jgi:hypothetical protein